jgi:hypothetical protein
VPSRGTAGVPWLRRFGVSRAGVDLAGGDEQEADLGARECCHSGRRPMRKMVATNFFFFFGYSFLDFFLLMGFIFIFIFIFWVFLFVFWTFVIHSNFLGFF